MSKWTFEDIKLVNLILDNLELNYHGGGRGHGNIYSSNRPRKMYGDENLIDDKKNVDKDNEGKIKISRAFTEEKDE